MNDLPLKDIHLPTDSLWWPPAPGWWLLLVLLILMGLLLLKMLPKILARLRHKPIKTASLRELNRIRQIATGEQGDERELIRALSVLLRRTVISYGARATDASLSGEKWINRLNQISEEPCFSGEQCNALTQGQYQPKFEIDIDELFRSCENWINLLPRIDDHAAS